MTEVRAMPKPRQIELSKYLADAGYSRDDLLADPNRPLICMIGDHEYVDAEDAIRFEAWVKSQALYARAGLKLPQPDLRPHWSPKTERV
jgi:hypothetical protein